MQTARYPGGKAVKLNGREVLRYEDDPTIGIKYFYVYRELKVSKRTFTVGYDHATLGYRECDVTRWAVEGRGPYKSAGAAFDAIDWDSWRDKRRSW